MMNNENGHMYMDQYSFMGMHFFWWLSILILVLLVIAISFRNRK
jgi:hypothetical protein